MGPCKKHQVFNLPQFKALVHAYSVVSGSDPSYVQNMLNPYSPVRPLSSAASPPPWLAAINT